MAFTPSAGLNCVIQSPSGTTLAGMNWTIDVDPKAKDVSNFVTGRARVPTLLDATLTFQMVWDLGTPPVTGGTNPTGIWAGLYIQVIAFVDKLGNKSFTFNGLVTKVTPSIASIEDAMLYNVEVSLSQTVSAAGNPFNATSQGLLTPPT